MWRVRRGVEGVGGLWGGVVAGWDCRGQCRKCCDLGQVLIKESCEFMEYVFDVHMMLSETIVLAEQHGRVIVDGIDDGPYVVCVHVRAIVVGVCVM